MDGLALMAELELFADAIGLGNPNSDLRNSDLRDLPALLGFRNT